MKILQINNCHYRRGGADAVYLNTIDLLKRNGNKVFEFSQSAENNIESDYSNTFVDNFDPLNYTIARKLLKTPRQLYSFEASKKLSNLLEKERPDIAHIHLYKGVLTASILHVLKKNKIPTCITLHDYSLLCPRNILFDGDNKISEKCITSSSINCILKRCNRKNLMYSTVTYLEYNINNTFFRPEKCFNKIIAVSKFNFQKHSLKESLKDKLVHLYNFFPGLEETKPNPIKGNYFLYYGRLSNEKGLNTLISAFSKLDDRFQLKVIGTGPLKEDLEVTVKNLGVNNIEFHGYKNGDELNQLIKNSSFVIVPSEWYENNPLTIVEGYSMGKPVIGSNAGGIPELISDNNTGYLFEMSNLNSLIQKIVSAQSLNQLEYDNMSKKARQFADHHFSDEVHYKKLIDIYKEMLS